MQPDVLISLKGVTKVYDAGGATVYALKPCNLQINRGEFVAIIGTSGSGKSTLMNILGCLDRPTEGSYVLAGLEVSHRTADERAIVRNRLIGFIFQGFNLLARTSALENCELPLVYRGVPAKERHLLGEAALRSVSLGDRMDHTPNQLSGGQQQRVAIARALVTNPPLLLADEPTGNLDTRTSLDVLALLQGLNRDRGITVVMVTHEPDIAACASRVITVRDGHIVSDERTVPKDARVALKELPTETSYEVPPKPPIPPLARRVPLRAYVHAAAYGLLASAVAGAYAMWAFAPAAPWLSAIARGAAEAFGLDRFLAKRDLGHAAHRIETVMGAQVVPTTLAAVSVIVTPERWKLALATSVLSWAIRATYMLFLSQRAPRVAPARAAHP